MQVPLLDLKSQYQTINQEIKSAISDVVESQIFILGPKVTELESKVASYSGCRHGIGVSSGSDALLISLMAEDIGAGDEVITTPYTFFATAGAIARTGARPVFVDIDPETYNINADEIPKRITERTKAIIPVHLFGQCADMSPLLKIAEQYNLTIIEDAAQAVGSEYPIRDQKEAGIRVKRAGSMGDYGCFSFFPSKNLGAFGDGGMVVTNDDDKAEKLRILRAHGSHPKYFHSIVGGNFRLDAIQAAILNVKLKYLDSWTKARQKNAQWYHQMFSGTKAVLEGDLKLPKAIWKNDDTENDKSNTVENYHIYNQYVISTPRRDALQAHLKKKNIGNAIYYPLPLHIQKCFASFGYREGDFNISEKSALQTLAIPIYPELTIQQKEYVVESVIEGLNN